MVEADKDNQDNQEDMDIMRMAEREVTAVTDMAMEAA